MNKSIKKDATQDQSVLEDEEEEELLDEIEVMPIWIDINTYNETFDNA